jgi:hypothetical protein
MSAHFESRPLFCVYNQSSFESYPRGFHPPFVYRSELIFLLPYCISVFSSTLLLCVLCFHCLTLDCVSQPTIHLLPFRPCCVLSGRVFSRQTSRDTPSRPVSGSFMLIYLFFFCVCRRVSQHGRRE